MMFSSPVGRGQRPLLAGAAVPAVSVPNFVWESEQLQLLGLVWVAAVLGGILGWEREAQGKSAGFRTHILVCVASALFSSVSHAVALAQDGDADVLRVVPAIATGIGFLGAGVIFVQREQRVRGLTTAAGVWATAAIGMATGLRYVGLAAGTTALIWLVLRIISWLDLHAERADP